MDYGNNLNFNIAVNDTFPELDFRFYLATNTTPERLSDNDTVYHTQSFSKLLFLRMMALRKQPMVWLVTEQNWLIDLSF